MIDLKIGFPGIAPTGAGAGTPLPDLHPASWTTDLLTAEALHHGHEFIDRGLALARTDRGADAALGVALQQLQRQRVERGLDRRDLRQHVDAIAILFHHFSDTPRLAFDPVQALQQGRLVRLHHRVIGVVRAFAGVRARLQIPPLPRCA